MEGTSWPYLYRVLRPSENPETGITAAAPNSFYSVSDHVGNGRLCTKFISTCATESSARRFALLGISHRDQSSPKKIITIDVAKLKVANPNARIIDLTNPFVLGTLIPDDCGARQWARDWLEVLVVGDIPACCITKIEEMTAMTF